MVSLQNVENGLIYHYSHIDNKQNHYMNPIKPRNITMQRCFNYRVTSKDIVLSKTGEMDFQNIETFPTLVLKVYEIHYTP